MLPVVRSAGRNGEDGESDPLVVTPDDELGCPVDLVKLGDVGRLWTLCRHAGRRVDRACYRFFATGRRSERRGLCRLGH